MQLLLAILFLMTPVLTSLGTVEICVPVEEPAMGCCHQPVEIPAETKSCCCTVPAEEKPCSTDRESCDSKECECRTVSATGFVAASPDLDRMTFGVSGDRLPFPRAERPHEVGPQATGKVPKG